MAKFFKRAAIADRIHQNLDLEKKRLKEKNKKKKVKLGLATQAIKK